MDKLLIVLWIFTFSGISLEVLFSANAFQGEFKSIVFMALPVAFQLGAGVAKIFGFNKVSKFFQGLIFSLILLSGYNFIHEKALYPPKDIPTLPKGKPTKPKPPKQPQISDYNVVTYKNGSRISYQNTSAYNKSIWTYQKYVLPNYKESLKEWKESVKQWRIENYPELKKRQDALIYNNDKAGKVNWKDNLGKIIIVLLAGIGCPAFTMISINALISRMKEKPDSDKVLTGYKEKYFELLASSEEKEKDFQRLVNSRELILQDFEELEKEKNQFKRKALNLEKSLKKSKSSGKNIWVIKYYALYEKITDIRLYPDWKELAEEAGYSDFNHVKNIYEKELTAIKKLKVFNMKNK